MKAKYLISGLALSLLLVSSAALARVLSGWGHGSTRSSAISNAVSNAERAMYDETMTDYDVISCEEDSNRKPYDDFRWECNIRAYTKDN